MRVSQTLTATFAGLLSVRTAANSCTTTFTNVMKYDEVMEANDESDGRRQGCDNLDGMQVLTLADGEVSCPNPLYPYFGLITGIVGSEFCVPDDCTEADLKTLIDSHGACDFKSLGTCEIRTHQVSELQTKRSAILELLPSDCYDLNSGDLNLADEECVKAINESYELSCTDVHGMKTVSGEISCTDDNISFFPASIDMQKFCIPEDCAESDLTAYVESFAACTYEPILDNNGGSRNPAGGDNGNPGESSSAFYVDYAEKARLIILFVTGAFVLFI